jgi:CelD/BcsL family acetyltransferase involved in cellulose biosynthesis
VAVEVIDDVAKLVPYLKEWDELAVAVGEPFCAPAWMLAWWSSAAPAGAALRVAVAADDNAVVGLAPLYAEHASGIDRYRFIGSDASLRTQLLARSDREAEAGSALAEALASLDPPMDLLVWDGVPAASPWRDQLAESWPGGRARFIREIARAAPQVTLTGSYDDWFASKSKNFREQMRRRRRNIEKLGATFRMSDAATLDQDLRSFGELHLARWSTRGGSGVLTPAVEEMLPRVAGDLLGAGRFRLWCLDVDGTTISSHLFLSAGGRTSYWLGGFDEAYAEHQPALQVLLVAIEHSFAAGDSSMDLGGGAQAYKYRLADSEEELLWGWTVPPGPRRTRVLASLAPTRAKRAVLERIPTQTKDKVKRLLGRATSGES